jgi:hypothetical protein
MNEEMLATLCQDIQVGWNAQEWLVKARQARIAKATQLLEKSHIEGVGECHMRVDSYIYHTYGKKYGYAIWNDKNFVREFKRDNPEVRVTKPRRGPKVGYGD